MTAQQSRVWNMVDSMPSQGRYIYEHIDKFACPEYYERREILRSYQRRGYADILSQFSHRDMLFAVINYVRMRLQIEYSLNHEPIYCTYAVLSLDWTFPDDPWKPEPKKP